MKTFLIILISLIAITASVLWYFSDTVTASIVKIKTSLTKTTIKSANNTGLVAYWNFDDCDTCTTAIDRSGNGYTGTLENSTHATGIIGLAVNFDGNGDDVNITSKQALNDITDSGNSVTYAAWINTNSLAAAQTIIGKMHTVNAQPLYDPTIQTSGKISFDITDCSSAQSYTTTNAVITTGRWYYVTITHTYGTGSSTKVYVNGELVPGSWNITGNLACDSTNTNPLYIGHLEHTGVPAWFNGKIDEVRIYNRALSAVEIKTLYQQGSAKFTIKSANNTGLVGYWNFDDCDTCSTAIDLSGNRNTGTFTADAAHTANGKINRGATFDGTGDYILVNDVASLDLTTAATVSAWFNLNILTCTNAETIVSKRLGAVNDGYILFYECATGKVYWQGGDGTTWASLSIASAKTFSETGKWYHVAGTFNGTTGYLYADGELTGSDTSAALANSNQNLWIGGDVYSNANFMNGKIDEVRIYNRVLSAAEIKTLYQSGR